MVRSSNGRTPASQADNGGSIPPRITQKLNEKAGGIPVVERLGVIRAQIVSHLPNRFIHLYEGQDQFLNIRV